MNPKYKYDFSSASIKHQIEAEFYHIIGKSLNKLHSATIVSGPDYQRHIDNYRNLIGKNKIRICEINTDIFIDIYQGCKSQSNVEVVNKNVQLFGSTFIDCDLTCTSDLDAIKDSLLKQIEVQATQTSHNKAFIFSFGFRGSNSKSLDTYIRPIFGLLGATIVRTIIHKSIIKSGQRECLWLNPVMIHGSKGRIKEYKCYSYNAGGGPMLTCLLIYK